MAQFSTDNNDRARVLILDSKSGSAMAPGTNYALDICIAACHRHDCYWEHAYIGTTGELTDKQYHDEWDMILVPYIDDAANGETTNVSTVVQKMRDTTIPVAIMSVVGPGRNSTVDVVTGADTDSSVQAIRCTTFDWEGRDLDAMYFYGEHAVTLKSGGRSIASDGTNSGAWQYDIGTHPTLWISGYSSTPTNKNIFKPWLCFQWMCDQQSTDAKNVAVRAKVRPSYSLFRLDAFDNNDAKTAYDDGSLADFYDTMSGLHEIWLAAYGQGDTDPGSTYSDVAQWFADRNERAGGKFRAMNHHTDVVDNTGGTGPACTSDGTSFDQFDTAGAEYERICDVFEDTWNMKIGEDGYGKGYPNVQNGNDMNNPAALFLGGGDSPYRVWDSSNSKWRGGYGCHLMIEESESYPTSAETPAQRMIYSRNWNGGQTITITNDLDGANGVYTAHDDATSVQRGAININLALTMGYLYCGGFYIHAPKCSSVALYGDALVSYFNACPHVWKSGPWEDMLEELKRGSGYNMQPL